MQSVFEPLHRLSPAAFVLKAIVAAVVGDGLLLAFILLRRIYRKRYFARRDARVFEFRQNWEALISGRMPYASWRKRPFDRRIVEEIALDALEAATAEESARLLVFLRKSGLIEKRIFEARNHRGWRRRRALVALGRTRAPEGIPALAEGLRDKNSETRLAALRGLGRIASPQAAEEILLWVSEAGLIVPALPVQNALVQCCGERPGVLLPYLKHSEGTVREVLSRVLGEVAGPSLGEELLPFVEDELDELRAAAARAFSHGNSRMALEVLTELARDKVWFVRLRAVVSLGKIRRREAVPVLVRALTDSQRLVRLRAGEALVQLEDELAAALEQTVATGDRYALHALVTAVENADLRAKLEGDLRGSAHLSEQERGRLLEALQTGVLPPLQPAPGPAFAEPGRRA